MLMLIYKVLSFNSKFVEYTPPQSADGTIQKYILM